MSKESVNVRFPSATGKLIDDRDGEGLRTAAGTGRASGLLAGVRKPPKDERAGVASHYGDLAEPARVRRRHGPLRQSRPLMPRAVWQWLGKSDRDVPSKLADRWCCPGLAADGTSLTGGEPVRWPKLHSFGTVLDLAVPGHDSIIRFSRGSAVEPGRGRHPRSSRSRAYARRNRDTPRVDP